MKGYLSIKEAARKWGISERWVNQYCTDGRIPGAERFGRSWAIQTPPRSPLTRDLRNIAGIAERQTAEKCLCKEDTARK